MNILLNDLKAVGATGAARVPGLGPRESFRKAVSDNCSFRRAR